jgi:hypothetical protein
MHHIYDMNVENSKQPIFWNRGNIIHNISGRGCMPLWLLHMPAILVVYVLVLYIQ